MKTKLWLILFWGIVFLCASSPLFGQEPVAAAEEEASEPPEKEEYTVKAYTLSIWGGQFSGGTFFEGQALEDRTRLEEGSDAVWRYDGEPFTDQELIFGDWEYTEPSKEIKPGNILGGRIGMWLSDNFHLDLVAAVGKSKAETSFINNDPDNEAGPFREVLDTDDNFTTYMGGVNMIYDAKSVRFFGLSPFVGFGIGGIINQFTRLEDKTALYFQMTGGFNFNLSDNFQLYTQVNATTFSFSREELHYGEQITYTSLRIGLSWLIDVAPPEGPDLDSEPGS